MKTFIQLTFRNKHKMTKPESDQVVFEIVNFRFFCVFTFSWNTLCETIILSVYRVVFISLQQVG